MGIALEEADRLLRARVDGSSYSVRGLPQVNAHDQGIRSGEAAPQPEGASAKRANLNNRVRTGGLEQRDERGQLIGLLEGAAADGRFSQIDTHRERVLDSLA